jgi:hypothetical protein
VSDTAVDDFHDDDDLLNDDDQDQDQSTGRGSGRGQQQDDQADQGDTDRQRQTQQRRREPAWISKLPKEDQDTARRHLAEIRRTASGSSAALRRAQEQLEELRQSGMSKEQQAAHRASQAEERAQKAEEALKQRNIQQSLQDAAEAAQARNPKRVYNILANSPDVDYDDLSGEVLNAAKLVADLRASDPYLFRKAVPEGSGDAGRKDSGERRRPDEFMNALFRGGNPNR